MPHNLPDLPLDHLSRPRLSEPLLRGSPRLRLLCACAGSGKSLLLRACAQAAPANTGLCWLDLRGRRIGASEVVQRLASMLGLQDATEQALEARLAQQERPLWIMLDHLCGAGEEVERLVGRLLQLASPQVGWWVASRRRPAWPLTRLLLAGDLHEVDARQLALSEPELQALLERQPAPPLEADTLLQRTRGWCAGAALDLLAARLGEPPIGRERLLLNYLHCELLDGLPARQRQALCQLACLADFDKHLLGHLFEAGEGAQLLSALLDAGAFIEPVGPGEERLRVHPAVAGTLAASLSPSTRLCLYRQACQYFVELGEEAQAVHYALLAEQPDMAASLMARIGIEALLHGEGPAAVLCWSELLPETLLRSTPQVVLLRAWSLLLAGRLDEAGACAGQLAAFLPSPCRQRQAEWLGHWQALVGQLQLRTGDAVAAAATLEQALQGLPGQAWAVRVLTQLALLEQAQAEGRDDAVRQLEDAVARVVRDRDCRTLEAMLVLQHARRLEWRGEFARAEGVLRRANSELAALGGRVRGRTQLQLARNLWHQGRLAEARELYAQGLAFCGAAADPAVAWAHAGLAEIDAAQGDLASAYARLTEALRCMQLLRVAEPLYRPQLDLLRARLWLREGQHRRCAELAEAYLALCLERPGWHLEFPGVDARRQFELLQARAAVAAGQDLAEVLQPWLQEALRARQLELAAELGFALAEAHLAGGRQRKAQAALFDALAQARRFGGPGTQAYWHSFRPEIARWAGRAGEGEGEALDVSQLSRRERSVLGMIAEGLANQEIAERLHISLHTVKSHAQRINNKLGVSRRTQAIVRAKALGLVH
ncbi:LuxR C-terminal-related transcriptional regulator [Pseudomonas sp. JH-2]|uniref:LuxR C-terminal-related transcriptional regulator n=1 Tax=Pseudomonas sp. JH-2 TaxID=3114998 RepID=UPI002E271B44|nr:LuxR C-terminal-related transcriptional regulator [Pseudomonas sp. JH-2]